MKILYVADRANNEDIDEDVIIMKNEGHEVMIITDNFESQISKYAKKYDVLINLYANPLSPAFLDKINSKIFTVFYCADDPYGSEVASKPFVKHFHLCFTGSVMYNVYGKMTDRYLKWGAKRAYLWPLGLFEHETKNCGLNLNERPIDLVHVGNPQNKTARLLKIWKAFPNMALYGYSFGFKGILRTWYHVLTRKKGWCENINIFDPDLYRMFFRAKKFDGNIGEIYSKAKVGINLHQSSGPVNRRYFQLSGNGVAQVCDCKEGKDVLLKNGKEIMHYEDEEEAIEIIINLLNNDKLRKSIARGGYFKIHRNYMRADTIRNALKVIKFVMESTQNERKG